MTLSQAANYLLPLITLPYVTRVVGPANYGLAEFATVTTLYFAALVSYGFIFTGTRKIAELKERYARISTVFSVIQQAKLFLLLISTGFFVTLLFAVPRYHQESLLMLCAFPYVIGWALYPDFLFQGRQDLGVIALLNLGIKGLGAVLIFLLIQDREDYIWIVGINSITQIGAALFSLFYAHKRYPWLRFRWQAWTLMKAYLSSGFYMFASQFFTRIYIFGSILFLGFLLPAKDLGIFAAALKLITVGQSFLFMPLGSSLYPHLAQLSKSDPTLYLRQRKRFRNYWILISGAAAVIGILAQDFLIQLLFGEAYQGAAPLLGIMAPVFVFTAISHFSMKQGLMVLKADRANFTVVLLTGAFSVLINYLFIEWQGLPGAAWAKFGLEFCLAMLGALYFRRSLRGHPLLKSSL